MECHRKLATESKEVAEEKNASGHDALGAMNLAVKAQCLDPEETPFRALQNVQASFVEILEILTIPLPNASNNREISSVISSQKRRSILMPKIH